MIETYPPTTEDTIEVLGPDGNVVGTVSYEDIAYPFEQS